MSEIDDLKVLAGIGNKAGLTEYNGESMSLLGSRDAAKKVEVMKERKIEPGTQEWFKLWFSRPMLTGEKPY